MVIDLNEGFKDLFKKKFNKIELSDSNKAKFDYLYKNEAMTFEGISIKNDDDCQHLTDWFYKNNKGKDPLDIYVFNGKVMNNVYHLTGKNMYDDNMTIVCIDWLKTKVNSPNKGNARWFSDVVDNNARREIIKKNPYYEHYNSIYYGNVGWGDTGSDKDKFDEMFGIKKSKK